MPVLIGILLIGASIPSKHTTAPVKPSQVMQPKANPSTKSISRQRALGAGKTKPHTNREGKKHDAQVAADK
jgi:hypothetical protein